MDRSLIDTKHPRRRFGEAVSVRLPEPLDAEVRQRAKAEGRHVAEVVRELLVRQLTEDGEEEVEPAA